jgi:hypothetical protein
MAENQNSFEDVLTSLALIVDGVQALYPKSKSVLIYELNSLDFNSVKSNFKYIKIDENQIKIDISNTEIIFILENSYKQEETIPEEIIQEEIIPEKQSFWKNFKNFLTPKKSS